MELSGVVAVVKRDCATCNLVAPLLVELVDRGSVQTIVSQDDATFPAGASVVDDRELDISFELGIETVPTLVRLADGARVEGWSRTRWEAFLGVEGLAPGLPDQRPGCGSLSVEPARASALLVRHRGGTLGSRRVDLGDDEDEMEAMWDRGWSDGLPVVPPTEARVLRMLTGTARDAAEIVAVVPPDLVDCSVEKVAVNAVMAGCLPQYLPVVLAAVEGACTGEFNMHGLLATTYFSGPMIIVNGPVARRIGINSGGNCFGQGTRANSTIGRALQLVVRNVGGGRPGRDGIDRATMGNPGKVGWCFAEDEAGSPWEPLSVSRGIPAGRSAVTLFAAAGVTPVVDQSSRDPEALAKSLSWGLRTVLPTMDAVLVVCPEHARVFRDAGWSRADLMDALPPFRDGGLLVVHAGGTAGMFSAVIGGWVSGATGSSPVTVPF